MGSCFVYVVGFAKPTFLVLIDIKPVFLNLSPALIDSGQQLYMYLEYQHWKRDMTCHFTLSECIMSLVSSNESARICLFQFASKE